MIAQRLFLALSLLLWGGLVVMGCLGMRDLVAQHLPDAPSTRQILYYVTLPSALAGLSLILLVATWLGPRRRALIAFPILALLALPAYMFFYTGGM